MTDSVLTKVYQKSDKQKDHQNISYLFILIIKDLGLFIVIQFCIKMTP